MNKTRQGVNLVAVGVAVGMAVGVVLGALLTGTIVLAGNLDPGGGPESADTQMYTLQQIYDRLDTGATSTKMAAFTEPPGAPASTMRTLDEVYDLIGERAPVPKTGQRVCYQSVSPYGVCTCGTTNCPAGQDGDLEKGVAWPDPRFTDQGNGTVSDNLTGLLWLKNANCFGARDWATAMTDANGLASGSCGLTDGSVAGDWRLPNVREMQSLVDYGRYGPALPIGHPFTAVQSDYYWPSTTGVYFPDFAWIVSPYYGYVHYYYKTANYYVWPVRGGQ